MPALCESICLGRIKTGITVKSEEQNSDNLPKACSCGSPVSGTSGRGMEGEGGGSVSVDWGGLKKVQSFH